MCVVKQGQVRGYGQYGTYETENFTVYSKFNSKNSVYYGWTPKNASGGQKWQISSDRPNLDSYGKITGNGISENLKKCRFPSRGVAPVILTYVLF